MQVSLAYFAGFFDGEGYVGVGTREGDRLAVLKATVTNDHRAVCEAFRDRFGGFVQEPKLYGGRQGKTSWMWIVYSQQAKDFLAAIRPYAIVKRVQIDIALEFPIGKKGMRANPEWWEQRCAIRDALQAAKKQVWTAPDGWGSGATKTKTALEAVPEVRKAIDLYRGGMSAQKVADQIGVKQATVSYWMRWTGNVRTRTEAQSLVGPRRVNSILVRPEAAEAEKLYRTGMSVSDVARRLNVKPATVNAWLRVRGVTRSLKEAQRLRRARERQSTHQ
jgi:transposase